MTENPENDTHLPALALRQMSAHDFALWGVQEIAYVKPVTINDQQGWAIHAADGNALGMAPDRATAFAAVRQNELEPFSVH